MARQECSHWGAKESEPIPLGERLKAISKGNAAPPTVVRALIPCRTSSRDLLRELGFGKTS